MCCASIAGGTFHEKAYWEFYNLICHQGATSEASSAVVPFLVELATDPTTPRPESFLFALAEISADPQNQSPHNFVAEVLPTLFPFLEHSTPAMRACVAHVLAQLSEKAETIAPALCSFPPRITSAVAGGLSPSGQNRRFDPRNTSLLRETYASTSDIRIHFASAIALINACPEELPDDLPVFLAQLNRDHWIAETFLRDLPWDWSVDADPRDALEEQLEVSVEDAPPLDTERYLSSVRRSLPTYAAFPLP